MKNYIYLLLALICFISTGCNNYTYTLNEQPIFSPPSLFNDYKISDAALDNCVKQAIIDNNVTSPNQLTQLNCSSAGIEKLTGLETFTGLSHINFNQNNLVEIKPLLFLQHLVIVNLEKNPQLSCADGRLLAKQVGNSVKLPAHCAK